MRFLDSILRNVQRASAAAAEVGRSVTRVPQGVLDWHKGADVDVEPLLRLTKPESDQVRGMLAGLQEDIEPSVRESRTARLRSASDRFARRHGIALNWCGRCTRVLSGAAEMKPDLLGNLADHRALEFAFASADGLCVDCALAKGAEIPCMATGRMFRPVRDERDLVFGHALVEPEVEKALDAGHVLGPDRSVRPATPEELEAERVILDVLEAFVADRLRERPRVLLSNPSQPHWIFGHHAHALASSGNLTNAKAARDADGTYHFHLGDFRIMATPAGETIEVRVCLAPVANCREGRVAPELLGAAGGLALSALKEIAIHPGRDFKKLAWLAPLRFGPWGAALLAVQGARSVYSIIQQAEANRTKAEQEQDRRDRETIPSILDPLLRISQDPELPRQMPRMFSSVPQAPCRLALEDWPSSVDVARARERLSRG